MDIYTLSRGFLKQEEIDEFETAIWTERYYGDGDFEISVEASDSMLQKLPKGQLLGCVGSEEPMILETRDIKDGLLKATGITLTQWLNNRTIRTSSDHKVKEWLLSGLKPAHAISQIVQDMCVDGSYLDGTINIGIPLPKVTLFKIPGLTTGTWDTSGSVVDFSVPFGPVYDAIKEIATTYQVGMKTYLAFATEDDYQISFVSYRGEDRTSVQTVNPTIRFSPEMDSFTNVRDLESLTDNRNWVFTFAPNADPLLITDAGFSSTMDVEAAGFDLKVTQGFVDDVPADIVLAGPLLNLLNQKAHTAAQNLKPVQLVDGQIIEIDGVVYGTNFFMGDIVEVQGNTGIVQNARITEYIRAQDNAGERAYPTLSMID